MGVLTRFGFSCLFRQQTFLLPVTLLWYEANGLSAADFVSLQGVFILLGLFIEVPSGYIADMFSKKHILLLSFFLFIIRSVLWLSCSGVWIIVIGEALVLLSRSFFQGIYDSYVYEYLQQENQTDKMVKYCGRVICFTNVGTGLGSLLCSVLYPRYSLYVLLSLELISTLIALVLMMSVPNIKAVNKERKSFAARFNDVVTTISSTLKDKRINHYILLTAIFASSTYVFIWSFQPVMKMTGVAVSLFGVVYFFNFLFRAMAGYFSNFIVERFGYKKLALVVVSHIFISLSGLALSVFLELPWLTFAFVIFICVGIGFQLAFNILTITKVQEAAVSTVRATKSSVNNMISQGVSGIILSSFKFITNEAGFLYAYISILVVYVVLILGFYLLRNYGKK